VKGEVEALDKGDDEHQETDGVEEDVEDMDDENEEDLNSHQEQSDPNVLYCYCRTPYDPSKFYIAVRIFLIIAYIRTF
jgi:hypothetical protein